MTSPLPQAVLDWHAAETARIEATNAYNAHLEYVRAHCPFGTSVQAQYEAMDTAANVARKRLPAMYAALTEYLANTTDFPA